MNNQPKKCVIYTAMVGGYDEIMQPKVVDDRFDYILFSNDIKEERVGVWQVRPIEYTNSDNTRICRYVKTHPEELLPGYEFSIWMDSNIRIMTSYVYERALELYTQGVLIASMCHPERDCIYDEAFEVMYLRYEREKLVVDWCHKLRKENYPRHNGLYESGVMFRKHNVSLITETNVMWWDCIEKYSKRDQLSFNYVLWKLCVDCKCFLKQSLNVRNTECFSLVHHAKTSKKYVVYSKYEAWLLRYCWKCPSEYDMIKQKYFTAYRLPFSKIFIAILGQYYRVVYLLRKKFRKI